MILSVKNVTINGGERIMKYKLICSDFDGTLLRDDFTVSERDIQSVRDYRKRGGTFVLLTGRMTKNMDVWAKKLGTLDQPMYVCGFNGGLAIDNGGNEVFSETIDFRIAEKIIREAESRGFHVHTYEKDNVLVNKINFIIEEYMRTCNITAREVGLLSEFVEKNSFNCLKIAIVVAPEKMRQTLSEFIGMNFEGVEFVTSSGYCIEAVPASGGKGNALKKIADYYKIPVSDVIAVGDHRNDAGMIREAGLGCCVANAVEELKSVADYVSVSNNENAISDIIEKFTEER